MRPKNTKRETAQKLLQHQEKQLVKDVGEFLVFLEEGTPQQIERAKNHAKSSLLKHGSDMQDLAEVISEGMPEKVENMLKQIDLLLHSPPGWIDQGKIFDYYTSITQLESKLKAA